jgi:serine phosphatase RsbU (regulator of sigma subunit)
MENKFHNDWESIFINTDENIININKAINKLEKEFLNEYLRIKTDFDFIYYKEDNNEAVKSFVNDIPGKLIELNVKARPFKDHCFSCIITDEEIDLLAGMEHEKLTNMMDEESRELIESLDTDLSYLFKHFSDLDSKRQRFLRELNYTIPVIFLRCGYELVKPSEEKFRNIEKLEELARAMHARYCMLMRSMDEESIKDSVYEKLSIVNDDNRKNFTKDFNELEIDLKHSSIDSAYHITTKLLSIGYHIEEGDNSSEQILLSLNKSEIETMSKLEHERWAWQKRLSGWTYATERDNQYKKHNCLVPYSELPELEKEKDRDQVKFIPVLLKAINYKILPLSPEQSENISYIPQQQKLLAETRLKIEKVKDQFNKEGQKADVQKIKNQLEEAINDLSTAIQSLNMAGGIQNNILPTKIYFKSCLPESFILHKSKDILSGDFYFVSRKNDRVVFAAADCTGHGTSAALLSMICSNYLDQAVNDKHITDPADIICFVYRKLVSFMKRHHNTVISDHGMEIAVCTLIPDSNTLYYKGIKRPLYIFRNSELEIIKAQRVHSRGYESVTECKKPSQKINLLKGDTLYIFSDGFPDQFGGPEHRNYSIKRFKNLLKSIQPMNLLEQYTSLSSTLEQWRSYNPENIIKQTDDILVLGVRV